jgi:hypothetical protein
MKPPNNLLTNKWLDVIIDKTSKSSASHAMKAVSENID